MSALVDALAGIAGDLDALGRAWALVGALAVAAHAEARATLDVDVAVAVTDPTDAASLVAALRARGYLWKADFGTAMTSLEVPGGPPPGLRLDLLFGLAGIEPEVARDAQRMEVVAGLALPVALRGDLIALKLLSAAEPSREHDYRDLRALLAGATADDLRRARSSLALLAARGATPPGRLEAELERLRSSA